jgi:hypothetical protein
MQPQQASFKGPGHWRSQADGAQRPDSIFADLAEAARRLGDKGLDEARAKVHEAEAALQGRDHEAAGAALRAAARLAQGSAPAHAAGLRAMAVTIEGAAPAPAPAGKPRPDTDETTEQLPALED